LRRTTSPLGVTARRLAATAPPLSSALVRIEGFRRDAAPALRTAVQVAPALTRLGREATPVIRRALPPLEGLRGLSARTIPAIGSTLDRSMDNVLATVENWSRAVQFSDQLGHVFRGEASFAPDAIQSAIRRLTRTLEKRSNARATKRRPRQATQGPAKPVTQRLRPTVTVPPVVGDVLHHLPAGAQKLVDPRPAARDRPRSKLLLDYLLGP
jgi:phospholipid/cholesterol/gamma-HCH transport system substrate-binding protein